MGSENDAMEFHNRLVEAAARRTVALVSEANNVLATGVLASYRDVPFIVTVRHIAVKLPVGRIHVVPAPPVSIHVVPDAEARDRLHEIELSIHRPVSIEEPILSTEEVDVALLRIAHPDEVHGLTFHPIDAAHSAFADGTPVVVYGYPEDQPFRDALPGRFTLRARIVWEQLCDGNGLPEYIRERDLAVEYEDPEGRMIARGMSGGGVWVPLSHEQVRRDPGEMVLAGIEVAWARTRPGRPLVATRIEQVRSLLTH